MARQVSLGRVVGSTIRNGNVLPTSYAGWLEGDIFVLNDTENNAISYYVYSNGKLTKKGNLSGEKGDIGLQGIPGVGVYSYSGTMQLFYSGNIDISKVALPQGRKLQVGDIIISNAIETTGVYAMITRIESETTAVHARAYGTLKGDNGTSIFATTAALPDSGTTAINTINIIKPDSKDVQTGDLIVSDNEETPGHYGMVETLYVQGAYMYASIKYIGHIIGEKGAPGEAGKAGTITIGEVNTGLPGTDVIVTNTGTEGDAILNFTIPAGKESVIDLGELSGSPLDKNHNVLDNIITPGLYTFIWMSTAFFMSVYNSGSVVIQRITDRFSSYYERRKSEEIWSFKFYDYSNGNTYTSSGDTSKKLYLIGAQTITDKGTRTYTHDTVYIDTDGHLYDSGKRVLTTADSVGGGTITGDYLPKSGGIMTGDIIFDKNKAKGIRVASYNTSGEEQLNQVILTSDTTQTIVGNKQQDNVKLLGSDAPVWNDGTNEHTILTSKGGTITGNLSVGGNLVMNGGGNISGDSASFHTMNVATKLNLSNTKKITYDDTYEYIFPDKSGTVALLDDIPSGGGTVSGDYLPLSGGTIDGDLAVAGVLSLTDSVYTDRTKGLLERTSKSAFGFSDEGEPVIVNTSGYNGFLLGGALDNGAFYEFPEKPDDAGSMYVPCTSEQGASGQILTSNGDGTYSWANNGTLQYKVINWTKDATEASGKRWKATYDETLYETLAHAKCVEFWSSQNDEAYLWYLPVSVIRRRVEGVANYLNITGTISSISSITFDVVHLGFSILQVHDSTGEHLYLAMSDKYDSINAFKIYY